MAPDTLTCGHAPNVYDAEPIPAAALAEIERLLTSGDLFRYTAPEGAPVALLEQEFADLLGSRYALAVSSCSAALFLSLKALDLPRDARVLIPAFTFAAVPSAVRACRLHPGPVRGRCRISASTWTILPPGLMTTFRRS
jgi:perosamine synthetase